MSDDATLDVAQNLREIRRLAGELEIEAIFRGDAKELPGGNVMYALGPVANLEAWEHQYETRERLELDTAHVQDEEDETPLQLIVFWTEIWRMDLDAEHEHPTLASETTWVVDNLPTLHLLYRDARWDVFEKDVSTARTHLENLLAAGIRLTRGIRCACRQGTLIRTDDDYRGLLDEWVCPVCHILLDLDRYQAAVFRDYVDHSEWLPIQHVERRTGVNPSTVKVWAHRDHVRTKRVELSEAEGVREHVVYNVADIDARHTDDDDAA